MAWLNGWKYRKSVTIARASGAVTDYQIKVLVGESSGATGETVDCGGLCLDSFDDLRFTNSEGTLLDYWIESTSGTTPNQLATVWVECDSIGTTDTTFYMYYGNADASAYSDGDDTFPLYDNFDIASIDTDKWDSYLADPTWSGSVITFNSNNGWGLISSKTKFPVNYAVRSKVNLRNNTGNGEGRVGFLSDFPTTAYAVNLEVVYDYAYSAGRNRNTGADVSTTANLYTTTGEKIYDIARTSTTARFAANNGAWTDLSGSLPSGTLFAYVGKQNSTGPAKCACDWILVRKYVDNEPVVGSWSSVDGVSTILLPVSTTIKEGDTQQYKVSSLFGALDTDYTSDYTFTSFNTAVATIVSATGLATAVSVGSTIITATNTATSETLTATLYVTEESGLMLRTPLSFIGLSENTLAPSTHVAWINSKFVANESDTNRFYSTDTNPSTLQLENNYWQSTINPFTCDYKGDKLTALFTAWQEIYAWGKQGLQVFQDDGETPFINVPGASAEVDLEAVYSVKKLDNTIFALCVVDKKRAVIKFAGRTPQIISEPIASILAGMDTVSDAIGDIICVGGIAIYMLNFPSANQTWAYDYKNDVWLRWGYFNTTTGNHDRFIGQHCCYVKKWNKYLIMSRLDGKIYELSRTAYDDAGNDMVSYRRTGWLDWNDISKIKRSKELAIKVKTFADDGTTDPVLMMRWRDEGYPIWSDAVEIPMNPKYFGDFIYTVTRMGSYRARQYEFRLSDGVDMALVSVQENLG